MNEMAITRSDWNFHTGIKHGRAKKHMIIGLIN